jgi:hypothetical protein
MRNAMRKKGMDTGPESKNRDSTNAAGRWIPLESRGYVVSHFACDTSDQMGSGQRHDARVARLN